MGLWTHDCVACRTSTSLQYRPSANREVAIQAQLTFAATFVGSSGASYETLSSKTSIRLLNIKASYNSNSPLVCTFQELDLRDTSGYSGYSALSYRWGDDEPIHPVILNGRIIYVRRNLWDFLMQARDNGWYNRLWIDALCINQLDGPERDSQVMMMGEIYSRACNVLVWLGPLTSDETRALLEMEIYMDDIKQYTELGWRHDLWKHYSQQACKGVRSLLRNPYWSRKWIVQELRLAGPNTSLVTNNGYTPLSRVADFFFEAQSIMPPEDQGWYKTDLKKYQEILIRSPKMTSRTLDLDMALNMYGSHICSDPRDNIYALLGISKSSDFPVDYAKPPVNLFWEVLALICRDKDSAQLLRGTGGWLQQKMGLSDDEVWKRWAELVKDNQFPDLWGHQFVEAMRMVIGELTNTAPQQFSSASFLDLPAFTVDFADIAKHTYKTVGKKSITTLYALFNRVASTHPSTIYTALEFSTYGPELGDYFVGTIDDANPKSTSECKTQRHLYADGQALIPFSLDQATKILHYSSSHMIEYCRQSEIKHLLLATDASSQPNELLPLAKDDIMCMFSGYQAALILRRLPGDKVLCGVAVVKFKSSGWFGRAVARFPMANAGSREVKSGTDGMGKSGVWKACASVVQVFMKPHSVVKITNWKAEVGRPWRGPLLNRCLCKPGEGGCV